MLSWHLRQFVKFRINLFREKMQNKKVPELRKDFIFKYGKSVRCLMYFSKRQTKYEEWREKYFIFSSTHYTALY